MAPSLAKTSYNLVRVRDDRGGQRCYANGRRITPAQYDSIWARARVIDCLLTRRRLSCWVHSASARN